MSVNLSERNQKIDDVLAQLLAHEQGRFGQYYDQLSDLDMIEYNYGSFLVTEPIDVDAELRRVFDADLALCKALLTMLFREDYFVNGSFQERFERGDVRLVVERMRDLLREDAQ